MPHVKYEFGLKIDELLVSYLLRDEVGVVPAVRTVVRSFVRNGIHQHPIIYVEMSHKIVKRLELNQFELTEEPIVRLLAAIHAIEILRDVVNHKGKVELAWRRTDALNNKMVDAFMESLESPRFTAR